MRRGSNFFFPTVIKMQSHVVYTWKILAFIRITQWTSARSRKKMGRKRNQKMGEKKPTLFIMLYSVVKQSVLSLPSYGNIISRSGSNSSLKSYIGHFRFADLPRVLVLKLSRVVWLDNYSWRSFFQAALSHWRMRVYLFNQCCCSSLSAQSPADGMGVVGIQNARQSWPYSWTAQGQGLIPIGWYIYNEGSKIQIWLLH